MYIKPYIKLSALVALSFITSCVTIDQINLKDNIVSAKVDAKVNTNVDATANIDTNVKTGNINADVNQGTNYNVPIQGSLPINPSPTSNIKSILSVGVSSTTINLNKDEQDYVIGTVNWNDGTHDDNIIWSSSDNLVVSVDSSGNIKALSAGNAIIKATSKYDVSKSASVNILVSDSNNNHPVPPDPNQPQTEDDFWKLMQRFGFMQTRTKAMLLADIKSGVAMKITGWSTGTVKDANQNIIAKYNNATTKKYMNPYPETVEEYARKSLFLGNKPIEDVDFYLDVEYGAKDGKGVINMQRVEPKNLEVLYYNKSGLITNYTQTSLPETGPPPLLRLTHFMFIPPAVYK